eukprot:1807125-Amphidinium_carterae.1
MTSFLISNDHLHKVCYHVLCLPDIFSSYWDGSSIAEGTALRQKSVHGKRLIEYQEKERLCFKQSSLHPVLLFLKICNVATTACQTLKP